MSSVIVYGNPKRRAKRTSKRRRVAARSAPSMRSNPSRKRRSRRRVRRNPSFGGIGRGLGKMSIGGLSLPGLVLGGVGAFGLDMGFDYVSKWLPTQAQSGIGKYAAKGGLIVVGTMLLSKFVGKSMAVSLGSGAGAVLVGEALHELTMPKGAAATAGYELGRVGEYQLGSIGSNGWGPGWASTNQAIDS